MTSIFIGKTGLRLKYADVTPTDLAAATTPATAVLLACLGAASRIALFDNSLDAFCVITACHPEADSTDPDTRLLLFELPCGRFLNFDMIGGASMNFDPGTKLFVHRDPAVAPTSGKVRLIHWG